MILRGHEDLLPKPVVGFDMGYALVQCGTEEKPVVKRYRLTIGPAGNLHGEPVEEAEQRLPDQLQPEPEHLRVRRYAGIDQIGHDGLVQ